jgi:hypothetical protein
MEFAIFVSESATNVTNVTGFRYKKIYFSYDECAIRVNSRYEFGHAWPQGRHNNVTSRLPNETNRRSNR